MHDHHHEHHHSHPAGGEDAIRQSRALLEYMLDHNRHHAEELHDLAHQLGDQGRQEAAERMHEAIHRFEEGNALLEQALKAMGEDGAPDPKA
jgi:hypothetical protein